MRRPVSRFLSRSLLPWALAASTAFAPGCDDSQVDPTSGVDETEAPLTDLEALLEEAPDTAKLPDEPKSDQAYPETFDLFVTQTPVRNQQSRGVCSIFSTIALMEHLYLKEGTVKNPDFSEQFLQWSVKVEVGAFRETGGSNATRNLEAINRFGVVQESAWPYEGRGWSTTNDAACTGDKMPVVCHTNGDPSDSIRRDATRFKLPAGKWISTKSKNIKAHMFNTGTAVVAGMPFYYQSWSHSGGGMPTNPLHRENGYIQYPNPTDKEVSEAKPNGHSILLVGWSDKLSIQRVDKDGQLEVDAAGNPVMETGFFLIKNSWGSAGVWGSKNEFGAGYGWISMRYIEEYSNLMGSAVPRLNLGAENCTDGIDNNFDGFTDCEAVLECGTATACNTASRVFTAKPSAAIPDNAPAGYASTIDVDSTGFATSVYVDVNIQHTFMRDIKLQLKAPSGREFTVYDRAYTGRDLQRRFFVPSFVGEDVTGEWILNASDNSAKDTGRLIEWKLGLGLPAANLVEDCSDGKDNDGNGKSDCEDAACATHASCQASNPGELSDLNDTVMAIPDNNPAGLKSEIALDGPGLVSSIEVDLDIRHSYRGDLTVKLIHPDGSVATLVDRQGGGTANIDETVTTNAFAGKKAAGKWTLWIVDGFAGDTGSLRAWLISVITK